MSARLLSGEGGDVIEIAEPFHRPRDWIKAESCCILVHNERETAKFDRLQKNKLRNLRNEERCDGGNEAQGADVASFVIFFVHTVVGVHIFTSC